MFWLLFDKWATRKQVAEAKDFLARVKSMNSDELAIPLVVTLETADQARNEKGFDVFDPFSTMAQDPGASRYFSQLANDIKKSGRIGLATGAMIWCHTMRATVNYEVRPIVREIWKELHRAIPHAEEGRQELLSVYHMWPSFDRLGETPIGMEADK